MSTISLFSFFFFNDTATTEIYTLSLHDALPISFAATAVQMLQHHLAEQAPPTAIVCSNDLLAIRTIRAASLAGFSVPADRSEEHTSELQSQSNLVCRLLLEKKKKKKMYNH